MQGSVNSVNNVRIASKLCGEAGDFFGAHKRGAHVVFRYFDPFADRVFVVGSFNGWSESVRMEKTRDGVWTAMVAQTDCAIGSTYKYKVYEAGEVRYVTDPYSERTDGAPYHNSIVCKTDGYVWGDGSFLDRNASVYGNGLENEPLHVYEMSLAGWSADNIGDNATYEGIARELSVYAKQMRYTHVMLDDVFARYYDLNRGSHSVAYYAPNTSFGDAFGFRRFVDVMHRAGIGVIINCNFEGGTDIYSRYELCTGTVLYWMCNYHVDGVSLFVSDKRGVDMANDITRGVRAVRRDAVVIIKGESRLTSLVTDCIRQNTDDAESVLKYFKADFGARCSAGLCQVGNYGRGIVSIGERYCADELIGDEWRVFAGLRALQACITVLNCKKTTLMGCEIGMGNKDFDGNVKWKLLEHGYNAALQLCYADLGDLYLSYMSLWQSDNMRAIDESSSSKGIISFERSLGDEHLVVLVNLSADAHEHYGLHLSYGGMYDEIFNSDSLRYGGSGVINGRGICSRAESTGQELPVRVPPLGVSVFKLRVQ